MGSLLICKPWRLLGADDIGEALPRKRQIRATTVEVLSAKFWRRRMVLAGGPRSYENTTGD
jgi:hypothetical protein